MTQVTQVLPRMAMAETDVRMTASRMERPNSNMQGHSQERGTLTDAYKVFDTRFDEVVDALDLRRGGARPAEADA